MKTVGLDIGTTTICAVLVDGESGELIEAKTLPNTAELETTYVWEKLQNAEEIMTICRSLMEYYVEQGEDIVSIGVTGQMHGILYLDNSGDPVTPLYTWQDGRGNQIYEKEQSYSEYLSKQLGYPLASGYGIVTHFYLQKNRLIPQEAVVFCTIADFVAMKLGNAKTPILHPSMAAGIGAYQLQQGGFDITALKKENIALFYLPQVSLLEKKVLYKNSRIPVALALGDNQASFLGSVGEDSDLLVNVGTGSQISVFCSEVSAQVGGEFRPYTQGNYLCVGSSLCGGYAYALLKNFLQEVLSLGDGKIPEDMYQRMNEAARKVYEESDKVQVATQFQGTRENPNKKGAIRNLGVHNFHQEALILGTLQGVCDELYGFYENMSCKITNKKILSASGNGIRMNPVLQRIFSDTFLLDLKIPEYAEEASYGSALFSLYVNDSYKTVTDVQKLLKYQSNEDKNSQI